ncbi:MAG: hypothetical protein JXB49_23825 [Bacteroidales bacterium]|nr:hypothetical protein [Bacteroidales bacterium]
METPISNTYFDKYVNRKIEATEELIQLTRNSLCAERPKFWKIKQLRCYCKCLKEANEKIKQLNWMMKEMDMIYLS